MANQSRQESCQGLASTTSDSVCPHPEAGGARWGDPPNEARRVQLDTLAEQQRAWVEQPEATPLGISIFKGVYLTGADVFWLATRVWAGPDADQAAMADAAKRLCTQDDTVGFDLDLAALHLEGAVISEAHLEGATLTGAHLEGAVISEAHLEDANLAEAHLERAYLTGAHLERAALTGAHLEDANLNWADLEDADLRAARLERADLSAAGLEHADLREAHLDEDTTVEDASFGPGSWRNWLDQLRWRNRNASLGDIKWHGADLTATPWERVRRLGDERDAGLRDGANAHRAVVRAYRQVAQRLREQGMADDADRFSYRAQICQRGVLLRTFRLPQYLFSWLLAILAGYGYRPERTLFWYAVTILGFMWGYVQVTHGAPLFGLTEPVGTQPLHWYEALVLSLASFHGRGFFPQNISLGDPVAILAAGEAVIGVFVAISFIATFTQRYFGAR